MFDQDLYRFTPEYLYFRTHHSDLLSVNIAIHCPDRLETHQGIKGRGIANIPSMPQLITILKKIVDPFIDPAVGIRKQSNTHHELHRGIVVVR
jgi:hypothetical protein